MNTPAASASPSRRPVVEVLYLATAVAFFVWLVLPHDRRGATLLTFTLVPVTFVLFTLDALRKDELYPSLGPVPNYVIAAVYCAISITVSAYMFVEFEALGTVRAGIWDPSDLWLGGLVALCHSSGAWSRSTILAQESIDARTQPGNVESMRGGVLGRDAVSSQRPTADSEGQVPMRAIRQCCRHRGGGCPGEVWLDQHDSRYP